MDMSTCTMILTDTLSGTGRDLTHGRQNGGTPGHLKARFERYGHCMERMRSKVGGVPPPIGRSRSAASDLAGMLTFMLLQAVSINLNINSPIAELFWFPSVFRMIPVFRICVSYLSTPPTLTSSTATCGRPTISPDALAPLCRGVESLRATNTPHSADHSPTAADIQLHLTSFLWAGSSIAAIDRARQPGVTLSSRLAAHTRTTRERSERLHTWQNIHVWDLGSYTWDANIYGHVHMLSHNGPHTVA